MFHHSKKAQGDIITTILIILIAVVAIALISVIVIGVISHARITIEGTTDCQSLDAMPIACTYNSTNTYGVYSLKLSNNSTLRNISLIFTNNNGSTTLQSIDTAGISSGSSSYLLSTNNSLNPPVQLSLSFAIVSGGEVINCPVSSEIGCDYAGTPDITQINPSNLGLGTSSGGGGSGSGGTGTGTGSGGTNTVSAPTNFEILGESQTSGVYSAYDASNGNVSLNFSWADNSNGVDEFYLDVSTDGIWRAPFASYPTGTDTTQISFPINHQYGVRVYAYNSTDNSSYSNEIDFTITNQSS